MKKILFYLLVIFASYAHAQVSINTDGSQPDGSAILDIKSTDRGLLIPRMTTAQRDAIASPAVGLHIFNSDSNCKQVYCDAQWYDVWCYCASPEVTVQPVEQFFLNGDTVSFYLTATGDGLSYQWYESTDGGSNWSTISNGGSNPEYSGATTDSLSLADVPVGYNGYTYRCIVSGACSPADTSDAVSLTLPRYPEGSVFCLNGGADSTAIVEVVSGTGRIWMDRNLGASQAATASDDYQSYGSLYQWGRFSDGHQCINWTSSTGSDGEEQNHETSTLSATDDPGHDDFIVTVSSPYDWRSSQNDNLWQGVSGINNPCPSGYRLPTGTELGAEVQSWSTIDADGAYTSPLKLPVAGQRYPTIGSLENVGSYGYYWSSTVNGANAGSLVLYSAAGVSYNFRSMGHSVRCIKDY